MLKKEIKELTEKLFCEFIESDISVRELARRNNIPFTTLRDRFKVVKGLDYMTYKGGEGTIHKIILESIKSMPYKQRVPLLKWYSENKNELLIASRYDNKRGKKFYSNEKENKDSRNYCFLPFNLSDSPFLY